MAIKCYKIFIQGELVGKIDCSMNTLNSWNPPFDWVQIY